MAPKLRHTDNLSLVCHGVKDIRLEQTPIANELGPNEVLLETDCVGICGSDVHFWQTGRLGEFVVTKPMILGHETSATVCRIGSEVTNVKVGQRVAVEPGEGCMRCETCKSGRYNLCPQMRFHATPDEASPGSYDGTLRRYFPHPAHLCFPLPDHVNSELGAMVEPLSVALHACKRGNLKLGASVLICGAGPIGLLTTVTVQAFGAKQITVIDINEKRLGMAKQLGATSTILIGPDDSEEEIARKAKASLNIEGFDRVFECTGAQSCIRIGIIAAISGGLMVLVGLGKLEIQVPLCVAAIREVDIHGCFRYAN